MGGASYKTNDRSGPLRAAVKSYSYSQRSQYWVDGASSIVVTSEVGRISLGCFFSLLMIGALSYGAYKFAPPFVSHYQLIDAMKEITTLSAAGVLPERKGGSSDPVSNIQEAVLAKARDLEIPLRKQDIKVRREEAMVFITVKYTVPIELPTTVYDYNFEFTVHN